MVLIPYAHEDASGRVPVATLALIAVCVLAFVLTSIRDAPGRSELSRLCEEAVALAVKHPSLDVKGLGWSGCALEEYAARGRALQLPGKTGTGLELALGSLGARVRRAEELQALQLLRRHGYVPSTGGWLGALTSLFLHSGLLHLLGNMLCLWLIGPAMERRWGSALMGTVYLAGGILAAEAYRVSGPVDPQLPLVGASGAVGAMVGAFLLRCPQSKIRLFWSLWWFRWGNLAVPGWAVLVPAWMVSELWSASAHGLPGMGTPGTVIHGAGLGFGVAAGGLLALVRLERLPPAQRPFPKVIRAEDTEDAGSDGPRPEPKAEPAPFNAVPAEPGPAGTDIPPPVIASPGPAEEDLTTRAEPTPGPDPLPLEDAPDLGAPAVSISGPTGETFEPSAVAAAAPGPAAPAPLEEPVVAPQALEPTAGRVALRRAGLTAMRDDRAILDIGGAVLERRWDEVECLAAGMVDGIGPVLDLVVSVQDTPMGRLVSGARIHGSDTTYENLFRLPTGASDLGRFRILVRAVQSLCAGARPLPDAESLESPPRYADVATLDRALLRWLNEPQ
jgi:membrane associated rhomboid family serine protease